MAETGATAWRWLIAGEFRAFPMRFVLAGLAIAIGVALAFAVHVINRSAAESFGRAVRSRRWCRSAGARRERTWV